MMIRKYLFGLVILSSVLSSCEKPFGDKTDLGFIDVPNYDEKPIAFVPILPDIKITASPVDITIGYFIRSVGQKSRREEHSKCKSHCHG